MGGIAWLGACGLLSTQPGQGQYQSEFITASEKKQIYPKIQLLCSTFPQARRAVTSGYAAVLPTAAFTSEDLRVIRKFDWPFAMPKFVPDETTISIVWNRRLEEIRENFRDVLKVFRGCFAVPEQITTSEAAVAENTKQQPRTETKLVPAQAKKKLAVIPKAMPKA